MKKYRMILVLILIATALLLQSCGSRYPNDSNRASQAVVSVSFLKSSLVEQITQVILTVESAAEIIHIDTTAIQDGAFTFETFELPAGNALFTLWATDASGQIIYSGEITSAIIGGMENEVNIELLPAIPMVKLSPYHSTIVSGSQFTSTLEVFNIDRFFYGSFNVVYDPDFIEFEGTVEPADANWGQLVTFSMDLGDTLVLSVSRTQSDAGVTDTIPSDVYSLVSLRFRAVAPGTTGLQLTNERIEHLDGLITDSQYQVDGQTIIINP